MYINSGTLQHVFVAKCYQYDDFLEFVKKIS